MRKEDLRADVSRCKFNGFSIATIIEPARRLADCYWVTAWAAPDSSVVLHILNGKN